MPLFLIFVGVVLTSSLYACRSRIYMVEPWMASLSEGDVE